MARVIGGADGAICEGPFTTRNLQVGSLATPSGLASIILQGSIDPFFLFQGGEFGTRTLLHSFGNGGNAVNQIIAMRARGTVQNPTPAQNGDVLAQIKASGYPANGFSSGPGASIVYVATENYAAGAQGKVARIGSTVNGTTTNVNALEVGNSAVADDVRMQVFDVSAGALRQVSRGALDSGGAGFRVLRIPNA